MIRRICCLAVAAFLAGAAPASATIVDVRYEGFVVSGYDETGLFGTAGNYLIEIPYVATYRFDTSLGDTLTSPELNYASGGTSFLNASPLISAQLTINGMSVSFLGLNFSSITGRDDAVFSTQNHIAEYSENGGGLVQYSYLQNYASGNPGDLPASIVGPFTLPLSGVVTGGRFDYFVFNTGTGLYDIDAYGDLLPQTLTVTPVTTAVPEPATWAMMLIGFAGLGFATRRRREYALAD